jgi:hypothetical protein
VLGKGTNRIPNPIYVLPTANMGSPKRCEPYGDGKPIVVPRRIRVKMNGEIPQNDLGIESGKTDSQGEGARGELMILVPNYHSLPKAELTSEQWRYA